MIVFGGMSTVATSTPTMFGFFEELTPQPARPREQQDDGDDAQDE